ncbi:ankyrin repeat-containing domain protein [Aspergillus carlsbadensis]|nr:ankyrin repeat-containing domain protein [Aspergillus carlsbadensis]
MDPSSIITTLAPLLDSNANNKITQQILDSLQAAEDTVESEKDKETLNNLYLAADHLSDLTLLVFTNFSANQQTLKDADISAETVELVMGFLAGLASLVDSVAEFSQVLCESAEDEDDDDNEDDSDDKNTISAIIQEYAAAIAELREGLERCSKALDVVLCLTQVWLDVAHKAIPSVLGQTLATLQDSIATLDKAASSEPESSPTAPTQASSPPPSPSRLSSTAQSIHTSISTAHPTATPAPATTLTSDARGLFHTYICMGDADEVEALLDAGMHAMAPGPQGLHPVHYAAFGGHVDIMRLLVRRGAEAWAVSGPNGETPHMYAAAGGHLGVVEWLVQGVDVNASATASTSVSASGNVVVEVDVDFVSHAHGATALLCACDHGHLEVARFLAVEKKADPFLADKEGCSPLMKAVRAGHKRIVEMLLADAVDVEDVARREDGDTNADADAARQRDLAAARAFLENGAIAPGTEKTPGQAAIGGGMDGVLDYLLSVALKATNLSLEDVDSE